MNDKFYGMLGLAMRAGAVLVGEGKAAEALRRGKVSVLVLAKDASENTQKKFKNLCNSRNVPVLEAGERNCLGKALGRDFVVTAAVTDENFSKQLFVLAEFGS